jgi:hypothetical protein
LVAGPTGRWAAARAASRWVRIWGMTCSVLPIPDSQPHWQLARRWPRPVGAAGLTVTLCPATCSLTEMVTAHPRSVGGSRTYLPGTPVTKLPARVRACGRSRSPWSCQGGVGADRRARRRASRALVVPTSASDGRSTVSSRVTMAGEGPAKGLTAVPPWVAARAGWDAAGGGADRRSAENAARPHGSIARSAPCGLAAPLPLGGPVGRGLCGRLAPRGHDLR